VTEKLIRFTKMSGAGNDFVVIDNRGGSLPEPAGDVVRAMCERRRGVGADGLILVEAPRGDEHFFMRYYNADGGEADLCGNGARCVADFAHALGIAPREMSFISRAGEHAATVSDDGVSVTMPRPPAPPKEIEVPLGSGRSRALYLVVGVPHAVVFHDDVKSVDVNVEGKRVRFDPAVGEEGANANFVQVENETRIIMRTYERGVENETLACGTGATASAIAACSEGLVKSPVEVETSGGDVLRIHGADGVGELRLEGPAEVIYDGVYGYRYCDGPEDKR
jgi:diaminopimelate epimerase